MLDQKNKTVDYRSELNKTVDYCSEQCATFKYRGGMKCIITAVCVCYCLAVWRLEDFYVDSLHPSLIFSGMLKLLWVVPIVDRRLSFLPKYTTHNFLIHCLIHEITIS